MPLATEGFTRCVEVRIDRCRWERFKALCEAHDVTISDGIRQAIDDLYERYEKGEL